MSDTFSLGDIKRAVSDTITAQRYIDRVEGLKAKHGADVDVAATLHYMNDNQVFDEEKAYQDMHGDKRNTREDIKQKLNESFSDSEFTGDLHSIESRPPSGVTKDNLAERVNELLEVHE